MTHSVTKFISQFYFSFYTYVSYFRQYFLFCECYVMSVRFKDHHIQIIDILAFLNFQSLVNRKQTNCFLCLKILRNKVDNFKFLGETNTIVKPVRPVSEFVQH